MLSVRRSILSLLAPALLFAACRSDAPEVKPRPEVKASRPVSAPSSVSTAQPSTKKTQSPASAKKTAEKPQTSATVAAPVETTSEPKSSAPKTAAQEPAAAPKLPEVARIDNGSETATASEPSVAEAPGAAPVATPETVPTPLPPPAATPVPEAAPTPAATPTPASTPEQKAEWQDVLTGKMTIDFGTRQDVDSDGNPNAGAEDRYTVNLTLLNTVKVGGTIKRKPRIVSSVLGRETQAAGLSYDLKLQLVNAGGKEVPAGTWSGAVPIDSDGVYLLGGGKLKLVSASGVESSFAGKIAGKQQANRGLGKLFEYARVVGGKKVKLESKNIDPLEFNAVTLPEGPGAGFPAAKVSGRFDYDYDTGNWLTNGFRFQYVKNGEKLQDEVTGSVRWTPDPRRELNGRGEYEFNLRFNEAWAGSRRDESAFFAEASDEELFFAVDDDIPTLGGKITYQDTFSPAPSEEPAVVASKISYELRANKLTREQLMNFLKLWLLIVGPVNDE